MHRLHSIAVATLLFLGLITVGIWLGSYRTMISLGHFSYAQTRWRLVCFRGIFVVDNQPQQFMEEVNINAVHLLYQKSLQRLAVLESKLDRLRIQVPGLLKLDNSTQPIVEAIGVEKAEKARLISQLTSFKRRQRVSYALDAAFVLCASGIVPIVWVMRRFILRRRIKVHHCTACHYDLTGNTSGVCPECGTAIPSSMIGSEPTAEFSAPAASGRP